MLVFAQISDTHLDGSAHRAERAARVMRHLDGLPLDAVLVTGDIADHGEPAEYEQALNALASRHRVLTCPGNHDVRPAYRKALLGEPPCDGPSSEARPSNGGGRGLEDGPIDRVHKVAGVLFAMCDSTIPDRDDGFLADETLTWLDDHITKNPDTPTFVCFHHPPAPLQIPYPDEIRQFGEERLAAVIERHPQIVAVLCGHAHTAAVTTFAGRPLIVAPGIVSTLRLPGEDGGVADHDAPPGLAFHVLSDEGRLTTHYRQVT